MARTRVVQRVLWDLWPTCHRPSPEWFESAARAVLSAVCGGLPSRDEIAAALFEHDELDEQMTDPGFRARTWKEAGPSSRRDYLARADALLALFSLRDREGG